MKYKLISVQSIDLLDEQIGHLNIKADSCNLHIHCVHNAQCIVKRSVSNLQCLGCYCKDQLSEIQVMLSLEMDN